MLQQLNLKNTHKKQQQQYTELKIQFGLSPSPKQLADACLEESQTAIRGRLLEKASRSEGGEGSTRRLEMGPWRSDNTSRASP